MNCFLRKTKLSLSTHKVPILFHTFIRLFSCEQCPRCIRCLPQRINFFKRVTTTRKVFLNSFKSTNKKQEVTTPSALPAGANGDGLISGSGLHLRFVLSISRQKEI